MANWPELNVQNATPGPQNVKKNLEDASHTTPRWLAPSYTYPDLALRAEMAAPAPFLGPCHNINCPRYFKP